MDHVTFIALVIFVATVATMAIDEFNLRAQERSLRRRARAVDESLQRIVRQRDELKRELAKRKQGGAYR
jgi:predicted Holliday junction resolvase-like endonuclease